MNQNEKVVVKAAQMAANRRKEQIGEFCEALARHWNEVPEWRFGQLMSNFLGFSWQEEHRDIFFIEDEKMRVLLDQYFMAPADTKME